MRCVLDASAALSFVLADEFTDVSARILDYLRREGAIVPTLWSFEVTNGLLTALRRNRLDDIGVAHALVVFARLPLHTAVNAAPLGELLGLARGLELSTYDAAYLWLALDQGLPLATRDRRLAEAARDAGVSLVE